MRLLPSTGVDWSLMGYSNWHVSKKGLASYINTNLGVLQRLLGPAQTCLFSTKEVASLIQAAYIAPGALRVALLNVEEPRSDLM
jgi:hypothetical protein